MAKKKAAKQTTDGITVYCAHDKLVRLESLEPNPRNPNQHPQRQIELLGRVIRTQGWRVPITVSNRSGMVVRGHGRLLAAKLEGLTIAPVDYQDYDSDEAEWADLLADNRLAELSALDQGGVKEIFADLDFSEFDVELTGFSEVEFSAMFDDGSGFKPEPEDESTLDRLSPKLVSCPHCGEVFDLNQKDGE